MQTTIGTIFDIKKFSIHDGPGIRTTIFFKGCPLHCSWCHNPEGISPQSEIHFWENRCINCHECIQVCENGALAIVDGIRNYNSHLCQGCGSCADACPAEATELIGTKMNVSDVMAEIKKDTVYYDQSTGGVTFSGGEPLLQVNFLKALLISCKDNGIHTIVDTSGFVRFEKIEQILHYVDLFLYDLKIMDSGKHFKYTGVPNERIVRNLSRLANSGAEIIPRIPIIPGINDDDENIQDTIDYLLSLSSIKEVNILPYHRTASDKYQRMGNDYHHKDLHPPTGEHLEKIAWKFENHGFQVKIGG